MRQQKVEMLFTGIGLGLVVGFSLALTLGASADKPPSQSAAVTSTPQLPSITSTSAGRRTAVTDAVAMVAPSVVSITTEQPTQTLFSHLYGAPATSSEGSGVVIDSQGVVLTNAHVVSSAQRITVTFSDGWSGDAEVVGLAEDLDLAVLRITAREALTAAPLGRSSDIILGESVIAIGNPFGLGHTVTTGVVSATKRPIETGKRILQDFIQTDASINPGSSGGPLLNTLGEVIGINTAIRPDAQGIGFAIPIDRANKVAKDLIQSGTVQLPWLGVLLQDVVFQSGLSHTSVPEVIHTVNTGADAENPLKKGDVIVGIAGRRVQGRADLNAYLAGFSPGESFDLTVIRGNQQVEVTMISRTIQSKDIASRVERFIGFELTDDSLTTGVDVRVKSVSRGGTAAQIGLRSDDRIIAIDGQRVRSAQDALKGFERAIERHRSSALITVRRGQIQGRISLQL